MEYAFAGLIGFISGGVAAAILNAYRDYRMKQKVKQVLARSEGTDHQSVGPRHP